MLSAEALRLSCTKGELLSNLVIRTVTGTTNKRCEITTGESLAINPIQSLTQSATLISVVSMAVDMNSDEK